MSNALSWRLFERQLSAFPSILEVRGRGLMIGFDLPESKSALRKICYSNINLYRRCQAQYYKAVAFPGSKKRRLNYSSER